MFSQQVEEYKTYSLRRDERYIIKKYFNGKGITRNKKVLVLGCGAGRTLLPLYKMGFEVTGIDITPKMVEAAKQKVAGLPIIVWKMDACRLRLPKDSFDIVFFPFNTIESIYPDIFKAILEARRVMKAHGVFVFNCHNRFNLKALLRFFEGSYANYYGMTLYRATPLDWWKLRNYFQKITIIPSTSISVDWKAADWRDVIFKLLPFFDRTHYFICQGKKETEEILPRKKQDS